VIIERECEKKMPPAPVVVGGVYLLKADNSPRLLVQIAGDYKFVCMERGISCHTAYSLVSAQSSIEDMYTYCPNAKIVIPA
jgi:hypothetical protein